MWARTVSPLGTTRSPLPPPSIEDARTIFRAEQLGELEAVLGCKLTQIEAHY
jgi:hypothetical protein